MKYLDFKLILQLSLFGLVMAVATVFVIPSNIDSPRLMMLMTGPVIGVISGVVLGLFAFIASKIVKPVAA